MAYPDPLLTASLYCSGHLDEAAERVLVPLGRELARLDPEGRSYLWFLRYRRGGEHLKLRLHAPEELRSRLETRVAETAAAFLESFEPPAEEVPGSNAPPLDDEDKVDHADGTFLWTTTRRHPLVLGPPPLLDDDAWAAAVTECLGRGAALALDELERRGAAGFHHSRRQKALLGIVAAGLGALYPDPGERAAYLRYHRDWTVRLPVLRSARGPGKARQLVERFAGEAERLGDDAQERLAEMTATFASDDGLEAGTLAFRAALVSLRRALEPHLGDPALDVDPFADRPLDPMLYRVLHRVAHQLGVNPLNEGLAYHLLLAAVDDEAGDAGAFVLVPGQAGREEVAGEADAGERFLFETDYPWISLVAATGDDGARWRQSYRDHGAVIARQLSEAIDLLRRRQVPEGKDLLDRAEAARQALFDEHPSIFYVLGRFMNGSLAYYYYCVDDLAGVEKTLEDAAQAVRRAVELERALLPFAAVGTDIPLKRARLARDRGRWREMDDELEVFRQMKTDRRPLLELDDGTRVTHAAIGELLASRPGLDEGMERAVRYLSDEAWRRRELHRSLEILYTLNGWQIPYP